MPIFENTNELKLRVIGLSRTERAMVEAVVRLSRRREPRLAIVESGAAADVFIVDANDPGSMQAWRSQASGSGNACVLLVDGQATGARQLAVPRPVQWSLLPAIIARAMQSGLQVSASARQSVSQADAADASNTSHAQFLTGSRELAAGPASGLHPSIQPKAHAPSTDILVVDDSLPIRNFMQAALRPCNLRILFAENGEQALQMAQKQAFACIFLDVVMPGIDGYQVCRAIKSAKQMYGKPAVVMLTSKSSPFDKIRGTMSGCNAYLTKPVEKERLLELIAKFVPCSQAVPSMLGSSLAA